MKFDLTKSLKPLLKSNKAVDLTSDLYNIEQGINTLSKENVSQSITRETKRKIMNADGKIAGSYIGIPDTNQSSSSMYHISHQELGAIKAYMSGGSYEINAKLREGVKLSQQQEHIVNNTDKALSKLPSYNKPTWRNIGFDLQGNTEYNKFIKEHKVGATVTYPAFTSTTKTPDGYPMSSESKLIAKMRIEGKNGKDIEKHGMSSEQEVLFGRNSKFEIINSQIDKSGISYFHLKEV